MFRNLLLYIFVLPANSIVTISKNDEYLCKFDRSAARTHIAFVFSSMHVRPTVCGQNRLYDALCRGCVEFIVFVPLNAFSNVIAYR